MLLLSCISIGIQAQDIIIKSYQEVIKIHKKGKKFSRNVQIEGFVPARKTVSLEIPFTTLEKVDKCTIIEHWPSGKKRKIPQQDIKTQSLSTNVYYSGIKAKTYLFEAIPYKRRLDIRYTKNCSELFFLNKLVHNNSHNEANYEIHVPDGFKLLYHPGSVSPEKEQLKNGDIIYYFNLSNKLSHLRLLVHKEEEEEEAWAALNKWYLHLFALSEKTDTPIQTKTTQLIDKQAKNTTNNIIKYIQRNIKYIDIEDGINAVKPRAVNETFRYQYGDCKDMTKLFCKMMQQAGLQAHPILVATPDHVYKGDFPALSSFNHMIAAFELNGQWETIDLTSGIRETIQVCDIKYCDRPMFMLHDKNDLAHHWQ